VEICKKFSRKCGVFLSSGDFPSLMHQSRARELAAAIMTGSNTADTAGTDNSGSGGGSTGSQLTNEGTTNGSGQSGRGRDRNRGNRQQTQQQWFEGREPTLKGYVYDFTGERMPDQFIKMTKEIKNYVGRTYTKYMADLVQVVEDLVIQDPVAPADPDPANQLAVEVWKMELKEH
jgi:hypothetical protein